VAPRTADCLTVDSRTLLELGTEESATYALSLSPPLPVAYASFRKFAFIEETSGTTASSESSRGASKEPQRLKRCADLEVVDDSDENDEPLLEFTFEKFRYYEERECFRL
jgi:hypothetical protein